MMTATLSTKAVSSLCHRTTTLRGLSRIVVVAAASTLAASSSSSSSTIVVAGAFTHQPSTTTCSSPTSSSTTTREHSALTMTASTATATATDYYDQLIVKMQEIGHLQRAESVLNYDRMVFMPTTGAAAQARGAQLAALASVVHEKTAAPALMTLLEQAEQEQQDAASDNTKDKNRMLELTRKTLEETTRVPEALAARKAKHEALAHGSWAKARENNDFATFAADLTTCFDIAKEEAAAKRGAKEGIGLYDQMLNTFEMGTTGERIDQVVDEIETALVPLLDRVRTRIDSVNMDAVKDKQLDVDKQKALCRDIVTRLGYDATQGRIDVSVHPFTSSSSPADVRITSRFAPEDWPQGLYATIHEGGHAIYEQNLPGAGTGLEIDQALSMGVHESQSLFWERHVGKTLSFCKWLAPQMATTFGDDFDYTPEQVYGAINAVRPDNFIRVEADELTYPLHVLLRYRIEKAVVDGKLEVKDIPRTWNESYKQLLGVEVPDDTRGCLQDVHWSAFAIGYFPTYLLGSSMAAQLAHYCQQDIPNMNELIEKGEFTEIKQWLTGKVHQYGKRYKSLDELLEHSVGEKLNPEYFIAYLEEKYSNLYDV